MAEQHTATFQHHGPVDMLLSAPLPMVLKATDMNNPCIITI